MKTQKNMIARIIIVTMATVGGLAIPAAIMRAQSYEQANNQETLMKPADSKAERLEGSWIVTITPVVPPGVAQPPPFRAYASFARGGVAFGSDARRASSKQLGTWAHIHGSDFASTGIEQIFDDSGEPAGKFIVRTRVTITGDNEFIGVSNGEERDTAGNVISSRCGTLRGDRITIDSLAPQCQNIVPPQ